MQKRFLIVFLSILATTASAQTLTSKNGTPILPQEGDFAVGVDAIPFLEYLGNTFNGTQEQSGPFWSFPGNSPTMTLFGKYCASTDMFYRGRVRIGYGTVSQDFLVADKPADFDTILFNENLVTDQTKTNNFNVNLSGGMEFRRGHGRVQGYYGPEVWIGFGNSKSTFEFANPTDSDMTQSSFAIFNYTGDPNAISGSGKRITEVKNGSMFTFGVRGFVGIEYFFMANASIGGEFGWGIGISTVGAGETTTEYFEPSLNDGDGGIRVETVDGPGKFSAFTIDTDNAFGSLNLLFYF